MDMKVVEKELKKGLEATNQLRGLLVETETNEFDKEKLFNFRENCWSTIINSFDTCISILNSSNNMEVVSNDTHINSLKRDHAPVSHPSGNFGQLRLKLNRVKTIETPNVAPDGYLWRKYGRKSIQHAQHPREYYRCVYKDEEGCQATKHVQMISSNPTMYKIDYYSHHTCNSDHLHCNDVSEIQNASEFIENDCQKFINFEATNPTYVPKQVLKPVDHVHHSSSPNFGEGGASSMVSLTHEDEGLLTSMFVHTLEQRDFVYSSPLSPSMLMSPYSMDNSFMQVDDYYSTLGVIDAQFSDIGGAFESQDFPLWDHDLFAYPNLFSS